MGELVLDLRNVRLPAGRTPLEVDMGVGRTLVLVPDGVCVDSRVRIGAGEALVLGRQSDGVDVDVAWPAADPEPAMPRLVLDAEIGAGQLEVRRGDIFFSDVRVSDTGCEDRA
jgi:Cell wall-active antibiotics response 4TMS YvqF